MQDNHTIDVTSPTLRLALAQINPTVGDLEGNAGLITGTIEAAREAEADLVVLPELGVTGYPPEDLLLKTHFLGAARRTLDEIAAATRGIVALVGFPEHDGYLHNSLAVIDEGEVRAIYRKSLLPNYGVFDERRYFEPSDQPALIEVAGVLIGLTICEDVWFPGPPASAEAAAGAALIVNASASPYHRGKGAEREGIVRRRVTETGVAMALCNMVGGQDELIFDGHSFVLDASGEAIARAAQFTEQLLICDIGADVLAGGGAAPGYSDQIGAGHRVPILHRAGSARYERAALASEAPLAEPIEPEAAEVYAALTLGLTDYVSKNGFGNVVLGLSGGVDSALVAAIAVDALGAENVSCVVMPSPHSSSETQGDAHRLAASLNAELIEIEIAELMEAFDEALAEPFAGTAPGVAEENLQARIRGTILMALSNKNGWLVLTTGNKSEMSAGYATLYGDMAGGFAVIKDVPKTLVFELCRWRNETGPDELIPSSILDRAPSAELRPDQRDEDSLPAYAILDPILEHYVENDRGAREIVELTGADEGLVREVIRMVDRAEYKRRQAPPGIKITPKAFGRDRRLPITNRYSN